MNIENIQPGNPGAPDDFTLPNGSRATSPDTADTSPDDESTTTFLNESARQESIDDEIARADMNNLTLAEAGAVTEDDFPERELEVVLSGDLLEDEDSVHSIHSPVYDAPDTPGEVDIEALDESDLDGAPLPDDARLDPIEE